jgi:thiol-disulfide isomerase/thioredoxin
MKNILLLVAVALSSISCSNAQKKEFSKSTLESIVITSEGKKITFKEVLDNYKGTTLLVEVWASWCSDCVKSAPLIKELQEKNSDVSYAFISLDKSMEKWIAGVEKHQMKGDHYWLNDPEGMKGAFGQSIDLDWIPRYMVIDKEGTVVIYRATETDFEKINATLNNLK